ncbi:MAG: glycosyltransferase family 4 protein [Leptolyngbya sp. SIO3F4]|nr:glycosyltransferase family 4 protein [Leptolyngbya sp. SIO3F4]
MKIAFISHEYPPDTALGGIATYVYQVSRLLQSRGHQVEIFSCSPYREGMEIEDGIAVHRISNVTMEAFSQRIAPVFEKRHRQIHFDVIEGSEIEAPAQGPIELVPDIPLVVKLHTPKFLIDSLAKSAIHPITKVRHSINLLRLGRNPIQFWHYDPKSDPERLHTLAADEVVILTQSMADKVQRLWGLSADQFSYVPNPYVPSPDLLKIPVDTQTQTVTFLGRLESRKGVVELAKAIPFVVKQCPDVKFRFVGKSRVAPNLKMSMDQYLGKILRQCRDSVEFIDGVSLEEIPSILATTDVCAFPSHWENFPNVCLEAMAAARGIVGSAEGGMNEMLDGGQVGKLVNPKQPRQIATAIIELLGNPKQRMAMGQAARQRLLVEYNAERIGTLLEESYTRAIQRRQTAGSRHPIPQKLTTRLG